MLQIRLLIGIISIISFMVTFEFIRKRHLREEYAILWLFTSSVIAILSLWPGFINVLSDLTGIYYITIIMVIFFFFVIAILMHYSIAISRMKETNKELIQKSALLELRVRELEHKEKE
jgi:Ca2+/Na+ antiporter